MNQVKERIAGWAEDQTARGRTLIAIEPADLDSLIDQVGGLDPTPATDALLTTLQGAAEAKYARELKEEPRPADVPVDPGFAHSVSDSVEEDGSLIRAVAEAAEPRLWDRLRPPFTGPRLQEARGVSLGQARALLRAGVEAVKA